MDPVQHFEIPYKVRERAKKFYFQAFGWQLFDTPGTGYTFATTVEMDKSGMPKRAGAINGGLTPRGKELQGPTLFMKVGDLPTHLERIRHAGGTVLTEPVAVGPVILSRFRDPEGNVLTCFQDNPAAREDRDAVVAANTRRSKGGRAKAGAARRAPPRAAKASRKPKGSGKAGAARAAKTGRNVATKGIKPQRKPARRVAPREPKAVWSR